MADFGKVGVVGAEGGSGVKAGASVGYGVGAGQALVLEGLGVYYEDVLLRWVVFRRSIVVAE